MTEQPDKVAEADRRYREAEAQRVARSTPVKPWEAMKRTNRMLWAIESAGERIATLEHELAVLRAELRDDVSHARHWHDERLDQIWLALFHGGLLHPGALHELLRDLTDRWGRIDGCLCCADDLAREPFVPWPEPPQLTAEQREAIRDFLSGDDE